MGNEIKHLAATAGGRAREIARAGGDPHEQANITFVDAARTVWQQQIVPNNRNDKHVQQWWRTLEQHALAGCTSVHAVSAC